MRASKRGSQTGQRPWSGALAGKRLHPSYLLRQRSEGTHPTCASVALFLVLVSDQWGMPLGITSVSSPQLAALPP